MAGLQSINILKHLLYLMKIVSCQPGSKRYFIFGNIMLMVYSTQKLLIAVDV